MSVTGSPTPQDRISRRTNISVSVLYINVPDISNIYPETRLACSNQYIISYIYYICSQTISIEQSGVRKQKISAKTFVLVLLPVSLLICADLFITRRFRTTLLLNNPIPCKYVYLHYINCSIRLCNHPAFPTS